MTAAPIKLLGIAGSLRSASANRGLLRVAAEVLPEGASLEIFDLAPIPLYNADVEAAGLPTPVAALRTAVKAADGLVFATPEYNYSFSGVIKNAIDWVSRPPEPPFIGKPLAIMGTGGWQGTSRAQYHLRQVAVGLDMLTLNKPEVQIPFAWELFDTDGSLKPEKATVRTQIADQMAAFVAWIGRLTQTH